MSQENENENELESRRRFLKVAAGTAAAAVLVGSLPQLARAAAELPHVSESDPTAKALAYVDDASKSTNPKHKAGDVCANCQFYSGGPTGYGPCQLFPGKSVNAKGWCVSHTAKKA
jgi:nitrous oxide reductase